MMISFLRQSLKEGYPFTFHLHVFLRNTTCTPNCCFYCLLSGRSGQPLPLITSICPSLHLSIHIFTLPILPFGSCMSMNSFFAGDRHFSQLSGVEQSVSREVITIQTMSCRMLTTPLADWHLLNPITRESTFAKYFLAHVDTCTALYFCIRHHHN